MSLGDLFLVIAIFASASYVSESPETAVYVVLLGLAFFFLFGGHHPAYSDGSDPDYVE